MPNTYYKTQHDRLLEHINSLAKDGGNYTISNEVLLIDQPLKDLLISGNYEYVVGIAGGGEFLRLAALAGKNAKEIYVVDKDEVALKRTRVMLEILEEPDRNMRDFYFRYYLNECNADKSYGEYYKAVLPDIDIDRSMGFPYRTNYLHENIADAFHEVTQRKRGRYFFYFSNIIGSGWVGKKENSLLLEFKNNSNIAPGSAMLLVANDFEHLILLQKIGEGKIRKLVFLNSPYDYYLRKGEDKSGALNKFLR